MTIQDLLDSRQYILPNPVAGEFTVLFASFVDKPYAIIPETGITYIPFTELLFALLDNYGELLLAEEENEDQRDALLSLARSYLSNPILTSNTVPFP